MVLDVVILVALLASLMLQIKGLTKEPFAPAPPIPIESPPIPMVEILNAEGRLICALPYEDLAARKFFLDTPGCWVRYKGEIDPGKQ